MFNNKDPILDRFMCSGKYLFPVSVKCILYCFPAFLMLEIVY